MAVGGSTYGAKLGGAKKNNRKYGGEVNTEPALTAMPHLLNQEGLNISPSVIGGDKRPPAKRNVKPVAKRNVKPVAKRTVKPVAKRTVKPVAKRTVKRGGNDGMSQINGEMPQMNQVNQSETPPPPPHKLQEHLKAKELTVAPENLPMNGGRNKYAKSGGNPDGMPKSLGGAKKRVLTPYNKFVKKHFPAMKVKYPDHKAPQIMKIIAIEWKKQNK